MKFLMFICPALSGFFVLRFGGDSSSTTQNQTIVTDSRVVTGDDSLGLSVNHSNGVTVNSTDHGAVTAGLALGTKALDVGSNATAATLAATGQMFAGALGAVKEANGQLAEAYQNGQAGDQTQLKLAGFVVVGLAALAFVGTRFK